MNDLVAQGLGRKIDVDGQPVVVITTPFGTQVMTFVYKMDVNPAALGAREWALAGQYNRGPVDVPGRTIEEAFDGRNTDEVAKRYSTRPREDAIYGAKQNSLQLADCGHQHAARRRLGRRHRFAATTWTPPSRSSATWRCSAPRACAARPRARAR